MKDEHSALPDGDPFALFGAWMKDAEASEINDPNAMALATATPDGAPSVRMVLLKYWGEDGLTFHTNAESRKGGEIAANGQGALLFYWKSLRRQVRFEGPFERVADADADAYFATRDRMSRIGAHASRQSRPLESRAQLLDAVEQARTRYPGDSVPRPDYWTGFRLKPQRIEFWLDRPSRLHDRRLFTRTPGKDGDGWTSTLLYP